MITIQDEIAGDRIEFNYVQNSHDALKAIAFARANQVLALDTESTGLNCYHPNWKLRTFQFGDNIHSYVLPANARNSIKRILEFDIRWIGHNGPHDIRSLDAHLGYETGVVCKGETYLPAHHNDPRGQEEGGSGHGLKELAMAFIDPAAGKWEYELKKEFKNITIPIPGEVYKSGPRKGQPKVRKAKIAEGWGLINPTNRSYIAYAAADPILTYRVWNYYRATVRQFIDLYRFDHRVQLACDRLQRRAIKLDVPYTERYRAALDSKAAKFEVMANEFGCANVYSGQQVANVLLSLGAKLIERTPKGALKTDDAVMRQQLIDGNDQVKEFVRCILTAKRLSKRREAYADAMLREMDAEGRVHPSINSLAARTARMSVSKPALQQLPTQDEESE